MTRRLWYRERNQDPLVHRDSDLVLLESRDSLTARDILATRPRARRRCHRSIMESLESFLFLTFHDVPFLSVRIFEPLLGVINILNGRLDLLALP